MKIIHKINEDIFQGKTIYPPKKYIFSIFNIIHLYQLKIVILGQDPYHGTNQANGLAFSVMPKTKIPPTLKNIYKAIKYDIPKFYIPNHGYLIDWVKQGVMLLNTILTVEKNRPNSHANIGWEIFTNNVIKVINKYCTNIVFLLWGQKAQKKNVFIDKNKHHILCTSHPSPFSFYKGFDRCKHFSRANDYLKSRNIIPINWFIKSII
ncbi:uracil-DNA glycosylase [Enterobacteriaceae endosymbiont of Macroplea mutica]|nr:uracil-DNA glycosylase [Enterobacteriaceae endosymbiont of Macroplea mutica]